VGVEPTIRSAKERITGFEGREDHRTLFASVTLPTVVGGESISCQRRVQFQRIGTLQVQLVEET
jgi:hypothetical protein